MTVAKPNTHQPTSIEIVDEILRLHESTTRCTAGVAMKARLQPNTAVENGKNHQSKQGLFDASTSFHPEFRTVGICWDDGLITASAGLISGAGSIELSSKILFKFIDGLIISWKKMGEIHERTAVACRTSHKNASTWQEMVMIVAILVIV